jgi:hypothetical protein
MHFKYEWADLQEDGGHSSVVATCTSKHLNAIQSLDNWIPEAPRNSLFMLSPNRAVIG